MIPLSPQPVVYRGTVTGLRVSAVNGTAFIDNLPAGVAAAYADGNHKIEIYSSTGLLLAGVPKAQGSAETVDAELHTSANAASDPNANEANATTGWLGGSGVTLSADGVVKNTGSYSIYGKRTGTGTAIYTNAIATVALKLYKTTLAAKSNPTGGAFGNASGIGTLLKSQVITDSFANYSMYLTQTISGSTAFVVGYVANTNDEVWLDNLSVKQVTAPSISGATIVSAKAGGDVRLDYEPVGSGKL